MRAPFLPNTVLFLALLGALAAPAGRAAADLRPARALGAAPAPTSSATGPALREAAQRAALREAVLQVALALLPPEADPVASRPAVEAALGANALDYAARYRVVQDRGVGPRSVLTDPAVVNEYAMEVEAQVDVVRVRGKLAQAGLVRAPKPAEAESGPIDLVLEQVPSMAAYTAVRSVLVDKLGARSALPRELAPGRAVLRVVGGPRPDRLVAELAAALPPDLGLDALPTEDGSVRARFVARTPASAGAPPEGAPSIDMAEPKGY